MTRHELNAPFQIGALNLVPYALGEGAFWGEGMDGDSISRVVGAAGLRSSLQMSRVYPYVYSDILGVNGLNHKIRLEAEYSYITASRDLSEIPQYNEFDDNAQERLRERIVTNTFMGPIPDTFDPRFYAVRSGAGLSVTSPYHELVEDQQVVRLAIRQRLQTKVGPPDRLRTRDWMTLDLEASIFPDADRDNFGETLGLVGGRYSWAVSDRTTILANALYDFFDPAAHIWNLGVISQRSARGSVYLGLRQISGGPIDSEILTASYSYKMSPKWISTMGTAFDLREGRNIGQSVTVTRVGADFLFHVGGNVDTSKGNVGLQISLEPRFGNFVRSGTGNPQLSSLLGPP